MKMYSSGQNDQTQALQMDLWAEIKKKNLDVQPFNHNLMKTEKITLFIICFRINCTSSMLFGLPNVPSLGFELIQVINSVLFERRYEILKTTMPV